MKKTEDDVAFTLASSKLGLTSKEMALLLQIPERTARRCLLHLFADGKAARVPEYAGRPPVFSYRYHHA